MQRNTFSGDLILGRRLWEGAEFVLNGQVIRGFGLSGTRGVAGFPNGEAFRIGSEVPAGFIPRAYLRQTIGLSTDTVPPDGDQQRFNRPLPRERITITAGKFSVLDIFDDNRYAHDPRTQFLNWAFVAGAAFDFANDAKGFTNGVAAEWENGSWGARLGGFQVARRVNSLSLDPQPGRGWQVLAQLDRFYELGGRPGAVRLLGGLSRTRSQTYDALLTGDIEATNENPRGGYRIKQMLVLNMEQELTNSLGAFARLSWNDGRSQQWMYTQMDWAVSAGVSLQGAAWARALDVVGLAGNIGGLSLGQRRFLEAGGLGFIIGDGRLNYRPETVAELYYDARLAPGFNMAANLQFIANPGHNADRGPVAVMGLRLRAAF
ncbi:carbohydrate porin [Sediminicoccus sp. KRV36]|uniref:carbohydrate porin n=1 Tax=Sediminicoccus sp. KRV36 TaxID=3133721 RepID=UPI00200DB197|nr:carbohydrate porin [Sediminicoccus rosea]